MVIWQPLPPVAIIAFLTISTKVTHSSVIKCFFQVTISSSGCAVHTVISWFVLRMHSRKRVNMGRQKKINLSAPAMSKAITLSSIILLRGPLCPTWLLHWLSGRGNCYETEMAKEQCLITEGQICHQHRRQSLLVAGAREKKMQLTIRFGKRRRNP